MGKRGPAQRPTALKLLHGERHLDRINTDEPVPRDALPEEPDDLAEEVAQVWRKVIKELATMGLAFASDTPSIVAYCEAVAVHRRASWAVHEYGVLIQGRGADAGRLVRNPAVQQQRDAAMTLLRFAQEFGLTPSARASIKAGDAGADSGKDDNPFAAGG
jgi:P27 family predicted phage terminase small subunit